MKKMVFSYLSGAEKRGNTSSVSESSPDHLGGVNDARGDHVGHLLVVGVKSLGGAGVLDLVHDDRSVEAGVVSNLVKRRSEGILQYLNTLLLVLVISSIQTPKNKNNDEIFINTKICK